MVRERLSEVRRRICEAAGRSGRGPGDVTLVCVTKTVSWELTREAVSEGVADIGENRVQEALQKRKVEEQQGRPLPVRWHMIGHLQTNKADDAARIFDVVHSVDSERIARALDGGALKAGRKLDVLVEVNTSGEESKFGVGPGAASGLVKAVSGLSNLNLCGLMTMAPLAGDPEDTRPFFRKLRELAAEISGSQNVNLKHLSMGMTQDFEVAIEEGATMVRVGSAIFGGG